WLGAIGVRRSVCHCGKLGLADQSVVPPGPEFGRSTVVPHERDFVQKPPAGLRAIECPTVAPARCALLIDTRSRQPLSTCLALAAPMPGSYGRTETEPAGAPDG